MTRPLSGMINVETDNTKSYTYAQTKRHQKGSAADSVGLHLLRNLTQVLNRTHHYLNEIIHYCVICNKNWYRCKEPTRLVSIKKQPKCNLGSGSNAGKRRYHVKIDWSRTRHGGK